MVIMETRLTRDEIVSIRQQSEKYSNSLPTELVAKLGQMLEEERTWEWGESYKWSTAKLKPHLTHHLCGYEAAGVHHCISCGRVGSLVAVCENIGKFPESDQDGARVR